ncbi:MAG TPA: subclass B3 metallo-beta-lactamase [Gemmatimonadaceae bacterium]|nr:subclass B3 metallo-beta-lactamase [Gemmatimonadaceae bacterium]
MTSPHLLTPSASLVLGALLPALLDAQSPVAAPLDLSVTRCDACAEWNEPQRPFRVHGNTYYVGTRGLSAILVTSPEGHVLIDGALPESAPLIAASIRALGFRLEDVRVLLNSHAHYDHAGGLASLQRASGAQVLLHPWSAKVLRIGTSTSEDPQYGLLLPFPGVRADRELQDGEVVRVGSLALTAHFTGGHTPGGTTWSWRSCEGSQCWDIVYADSQSPISDDAFRFTRNDRYPVVREDFARAQRLFETMPCDVLLAPHPSLSDAFARQARRDAGDATAFRDPSACRNYAALSRSRLADRLAREADREP